ncbi:hypothetical protein [Aquimarina sediminis]|uniref:hypothetical protein n=1 Tax=Aquimarina sediminis TaxID=2070536 RepID=UPI000CA06AD1|nr:hypothetical protein [Aquimarina sediminis]
MKNYCLENGYNRLKQLKEQGFHDWYNDTLVFYDSMPNLAYWKTLPSKQLGYINVPLNKVIGTSHISYADSTWLENLGCLKRFSSYYTKEYCSDYFNSDEKKTGISYAKFGDDYIITQGNHRTHIARFLRYKCIKGDVQEYFFDYELYNTVNQYKKEKLDLDLGDRNLFRRTMWKTKIDSVKIFIHGYEMLKQFLSLYQSTKPSWIQSKKMRFINSLGFQLERDFIHIEKEENFKNEIINYLPALKYNHENKNGKKTHFF